MSENTPNDAAIRAAFANVLPKVNKVAKDGDNPYFSSKYQTLDAIQRMLKPVLLEGGLSYSQHVDYIPEGQCVAVQTILWDANGSSLNLGTTRLPVPKMTPQDAGSAFSYAKRYALGALFAIEVGEDDDGESAQQAHRNAPARAAQPSAQRTQPSAPLRQGQGWDNAPSGDGKYTFKKREWVFKDMSVIQLGTVAYSADEHGISQYPPDFIKLCKNELLKRVAAGEAEAIDMVQNNTPQ